MKCPTSGGPVHRIKFLEPSFDCTMLTIDTRIHGCTYQCTHVHTRTYTHTWVASERPVYSSAFLLLCSWHLYKFFFITSDEDFAVDSWYFKVPRKLKTKTSTKGAVALFLTTLLTSVGPHNHHFRLQALLRLFFPFSFPYWFHQRLNISTIMSVKSRLKLPIQV